MAYSAKVERKIFRCSIATATFTSRRRFGTNIFRRRIATSPRRIFTGMPTGCSWCAIAKSVFRDPDKWKYPGETWHPGLTKKIIGETQPGTKDWDETIGRNKSARDPHARLKDMDASGIDQVMIFPSTFVYLPLVENADAAYICARAYNDWAYDYCSADKKRLFPAAVLPTQNVDFAIEELRRVAKRGFKCGVSPADHRPGQVSDVS